MTTARPTRIGKYEVEGVVGEGAMGVVYRAMDPVLNRRVAIKVMSDAVAQNHDLRERFLREAQAAGSLQHPNVVTIYDFGEVDGHLYIAMEFVEGDDLEDLMLRKVHLPLDAKLELMIGVLHGLAFAHKRGVVHRDIKPANIRVDAEGKARIMDFGVAHLASSEMTATGVMLGTPSYMAPEQILGGAVTPATDIFSVGAVLYELLTDTRPFRGDTLQSLMYQILSRAPADVTELSRELPAALNAIVMRALQKDPKDRYRDAVEMADELATIRSTGALGGERTSLSLRATIDSALAGRRAGAYRRQRRQRHALLVAGFVAVAAVAVGGYEVARQSFLAAPVTSASDVPSSEPLTGDSAVGAALQPIADPQRRESPSSVAPSGPVAPAPAPAPPATNTPSTAGPSARELSLARAVQRTALEARRRAIEAGANGDQLRAGDSRNDEGESLIGRGRLEDAATAFNQAATSWTAAERAARLAAAERVAAAEPPAATPSTTLVAAPAQAESRDSGPPPATPAPALAPTAGAPAPPPATPSTTNAASEIAAVIAAYSRAIESRDIAELRRVYPGMTTDQRRAFEDFFRSTRSLRAVLAVDQLQVNDTTAEARLSGTYEYLTTGGSSERRPVSFVAALRLESQGWRLVAVR